MIREEKGLADNFLSCFFSGRAIILFSFDDFSVLEKRFRLKVCTKNVIKFGRGLKTDLTMPTESQDMGRICAEDVSWYIQADSASPGIHRFVNKR